MLGVSWVNGKNILHSQPIFANKVTLNYYYYLIFLIGDLSPFVNELWIVDFSIQRDVSFIEWVFLGIKMAAKILWQEGVGVGVGENPQINAILYVHPVSLNLFQYN